MSYIKTQVFKTIFSHAFLVVKKVKERTETKEKCVMNSSGKERVNRNKKYNYKCSA